MLLYLVEPESSRTLCYKVYKRIGVVFRWFFPGDCLERDCRGVTKVPTGSKNTPILTVSFD